MDMSSSNGRLLGEGMVKRRKRRIPSGGKKIMDGTPNKTIPKTKPIIDGVPSKTIPSTPRIMDGTPSKTTGTGVTNLTSTVQTGGKPTAMPDRPRRPRPTNPDLMKANPNGGSTFQSAMTVGRELSGMAQTMKKKQPKF